ncbi:hypothetical protein D3C81_1600890 [compost metagenome]
MARILANLDTETVDSGHGFQGADQGIFGFTPNQGWLERLANRRQRDLLNDMDRLGDGRPFMDMYGGMGTQFSSGYGLASAQLNVDNRQFTGVWIWPSNGCRAEYCRVLEQSLLDHRRIDVVPPTNDQILGTAGEKEETTTITAR